MYIYRLLNYITYMYILTFFFIFLTKERLTISFNTPTNSPHFINVEHMPLTRHQMRQKPPQPRTRLLVTDMMGKIMTMTVTVILDMTEIPNDLTENLKDMTEILMVLTDMTDTI